MSDNDLIFLTAITVIGIVAIIYLFIDNYIFYHKKRKKNDEVKVPVKCIICGNYSYAPDNMKYIEACICDECRSAILYAKDKMKFEQELKDICTIKIKDDRSEKDENI